MGGIASIFTGPPKPKQPDFAAQAAAQQAAREAEQNAKLEADRAAAVANADAARDAETTRLKKIKGQTGAATPGTGQLAQVDVAGLGTKLG